MERHQQQLDETIRQIEQVRDRHDDQQQQLLEQQRHNVDLIVEFGQRQQVQENLIDKLQDEQKKYSTQIAEQYRKLYHIELLIGEIQQQLNQAREAQERRFNEIQQNYVRLQEAQQHQMQEVQDHRSNEVQEQRAQSRQVTDDLLQDLDMDHQQQLHQQQLNQLEEQIARLICDRIRELQARRG